MLHLCISARPVSIPLTNARYRLITDAVGDTEATITLPPHDAAMLLSTGVGDEVVVWCTHLHRIIWRGQIEAMTTAPDGTTELRCLGLWRLIGDLPITTVLNDQSTARWEVAPRVWITGTGTYPNPDRWETSKNQYLIATTRSGEAYDNEHMLMWIYRYPEPQRYTALGHHELQVTVTQMSGIISTVEIGMVSGAEPPYTPITARPIFTTGNFGIIVPSSNTNVTGLYIMTNFPYAVESNTGTSRLIVQPRVNRQVSFDNALVDLAAYINNVLMPIEPIQFYYIFGNWTPKSVMSIGNSIRDLLVPFVHSSSEYPVQLLRDTCTLSVYPEPARRLTWRLVDPPRITRDWSAIPTHVYARYHDSSNQQYATAAADVDTISSRKRYKRVQVIDVGIGSQSDAVSRRDQYIAAIRTPKPLLHVSLPTTRYALATAAGAHVPSYAAEPYDDLLIDSEWTKARIVGRVISESDVTYDVTSPDDRLSRLAQR